MKMTILCAQRSLDMDVDLEHLTRIGNIDHDEYGATLYGTETSQGELFYIVLDKDAISTLRSMDGPCVQLSTKELFALGVAQGCFGNGDIDGGVHCILPVRDVESGLMINEVFQELTDSFLEIEPSDIGMLYIEVIKEWAKGRGIEL